MRVDSPSKLALGFGTGAIFGVLLQKGQVGKYEVILDQLLLREGRVLRTMGTAVAVGSAGVHALVQAGYSSLQIKPLRLGSIVPGAVLFGTGLALLGYCPGTTLAALGQGRRDALAGALGMPRFRFLVFDVLGAVLWVGLYVGLGYTLHDQLAEAAALAERLGLWAVVVVAGAFGFYLGVKVTRRQLFLRQLRIARISPEELRQRMEKGEELVVVDLRHSADFETVRATIPGSIRVAIDAIESEHERIPRDREIVLFCT